ncbi:hypothetical protein, partial [Dialister succinatiphilus]|uniref:hypothetical protein n=1 Tax=Dialister succinatiphilus TaxID=487173 RepID=UPI004025B8FD
YSITFGLFQYTLLFCAYYPSKIEEKISACFSHSPIASILSTKKTPQKAALFSLFSVITAVSSLQKFFQR